MNRVKLWARAVRWNPADPLPGEQEARRYRIDMTGGLEGPAHDPYSVTTLSVTNKRTGVKATLRDGSLSGLRLTIAYPGGPTVEHKALGGYYRRTDPAKFAILFRRAVGISPAEAEAEWNTYPEDPMGSPSDYV